MRSTQHEIFDDDIPFYQIVFKGYIPMSSAAVNLASSPDDMLLAAVEGGCSPAYSLFDTYDAAALDAVSPTLCSGVYADWRTAIVDTARMLQALLRVYRWRGDNVSYATGGQSPYDGL